MIKATKDGDWKEVRRILIEVNDLDPQAKDEAVRIAERCGYKDIVRNLCSKGAQLPIRKTLQVKTLQVRYNELDDLVYPIQRRVSRARGLNPNDVEF